jgi:hypothetical protein
MSNACFRLKDEKKFEKRLTKKKFEKTQGEIKLVKKRERAMPKRKKNENNKNKKNYQHDEQLDEAPNFQS